MCRLVKKLGQKTDTGYKVGYYDKKGNFCSIVTRKPYVEGKVKKLSIRNKVIKSRKYNTFTAHSIHAIYDSVIASFDYKYVGYTGILPKVENAMELMEQFKGNAKNNNLDIKFGIAKFTISDDLHSAVLSFGWGTYDVIAGKKIDKIIIKT